MADRKYPGLRADGEDGSTRDDCLYVGPADADHAGEIEHHLRFQTGTVHGAGKRIPGFQREPRLGEMLDSMRVSGDDIGRLSKTLDEEKADTE